VFNSCEGFRSSAACLVCAARHRIFVLCSDNHQRQALLRDVALHEMLLFRFFFILCTHPLCLGTPPPSSSILMRNLMFPLDPPILQYMPHYIGNVAQSGAERNHQRQALLRGLAYTRHSSIPGIFVHESFIFSAHPICLGTPPLPRPH